METTTFRLHLVLLCVICKFF